MIGVEEFEDFPFYVTIEHKKYHIGNEKIFTSQNIILSASSLKKNDFLLPIKASLLVYLILSLFKHHLLHHYRKSFPWCTSPFCISNQPFNTKLIAPSLLLHMDGSTSVNYMISLQPPLTSLVVCPPLLVIFPSYLINNKLSIYFEIKFFGDVLHSLIHNHRILIAYLNPHL